MGESKSNGSLNEITYNRIREDIMNLTLEPGTGVSVQRLADIYGVSRTPVREAFIRLEKDGLVEIYPQKKTLVSLIDLKRVEQEWFIRTSLELAAAEKFIRNVDTKITEEMKELIHTQKKYLGMEHYKEFYYYDNQLHRKIFETAKELLAWNTIEDVVSHYNRIRVLSIRLEGVDKKIMEEHESLVFAAEDRDASKLREILVTHLHNVLEEKEGMLNQFPQYFAADVKAAVT